jgi:hypothetical protein
VLDGELNAVKAEYRNHIWEVLLAGNIEELPQVSGYEIKAKEYLKQQTKLEIFDADGKGINPFIQAILQNNILLSVREILPSVNEIFIHKVTQKA